jgi:hypothetical protein
MSRRIFDVVVGVQTGGGKRKKYEKIKDTS